MRVRSAKRRTVRASIAPRGCAYDGVFLACVVAFSSYASSALVHDPGPDCPSIKVLHIPDYTVDFYVSYRLPVVGEPGESESETQSVKCTLRPLT